VQVDLHLHFTYGHHDQNCAARYFIDNDGAPDNAKTSVAGSVGTSLTTL
jgi:hypothetical protein